MLHIRVQCMHACLHAHMHVQSYMSTGRILHSPDMIAYAKVCGADSIAWRTQLHVTPWFRNGAHPEYVMSESTVLGEASSSN